MYPSLFIAIHVSTKLQNDLTAPHYHSAQESKKKIIKKISSADDLHDLNLLTFSVCRMLLEDVAFVSSCVLSQA